MYRPLYQNIEASVLGNDEFHLSCLGTAKRAVFWFPECLCVGTAHCFDFSITNCWNFCKQVLMEVSALIKIFFLTMSCSAPGGEFCTRLRIEKVSFCAFFTFYFKREKYKEQTRHDEIPTEIGRSTGLFYGMVSRLHLCFNTWRSRIKFGVARKSKIATPHPKTVLLPLATTTRHHGFVQRYEKTWLDEEGNCFIKGCFPGKWTVRFVKLILRNIDWEGRTFV